MHKFSEAFQPPLIGQKLAVAIGAWSWRARQEGHEGEAARDGTRIRHGNVINAVTDKREAEESRNSGNSACDGRRYE